MTAPVLADTAAVALTAIAEQRVAVGSGPQRGQRRDAYDFIPGSVVRGALAARWIRRHGPPDQAQPGARAEFVNLFESGIVRFGPLHPTGYAPRWMSTLEHKYGRPANCDRPDIDLADATAGDGGSPTRCSHCTEPLQPLKGGLGRVTAPETALHTDRMHVRIGPDGRPVDGALFVRQAISRGTRLTGLLTGPPEALVRLLDGDEPLHLGGNRTASGQVRISHTTTELPPPPQLVGDRVVLRLASPAIFVDPYGRPSLRPDLRQLGALLDVEVVRVVRQWVRSATVGGWHLASGLPKPVERAVITGTVYIVECAAPPSVEGLTRLARDGIGLRRHEGFGWLVHPAGTRSTV